MSITDRQCTPSLPSQPPPPPLPPLPHPPLTFLPSPPLVELAISSRSSHLSGPPVWVHAGLAICPTSTGSDPLLLHRWRCESRPRATSPLPPSPSTVLATPTRTYPCPSRTTRRSPTRSRRTGVDRSTRPAQSGRNGDNVSPRCLKTSRRK